MTLSHVQEKARKRNRRRQSRRRRRRRNNACNLRETFFAALVKAALKCAVAKELAQHVNVQMRKRDFDIIKAMK
jgi:hypothetical protein